MVALYLERFMNYGVTPEELRSGKPIIGIAQSGSDLSPCNRIQVDLAKRSGQAMADVIGDAFPRLPLTEDVRRELRTAVAAALKGGDVPTVLARAWNDALDDLDRTL